MKKEEILQMSQQENKGKLDEREIMALGKASQVGMVVGLIICVILVIVSDFVLDMPELSLIAFMGYFSMQGSSNLVLYKYLRTRSRIIYGIIEIFFAVACAVVLIYKIMV